MEWYCALADNLLSRDKIDVGAKSYKDVLVALEQTSGRIVQSTSHLPDEERVLLLQESRPGVAA